MRWGTREWFDIQFKDVGRTGIDGWNISIRGSQSIRLRQVIELALRHSNNFTTFLDVGCGIGIFFNKILAEIDIKEAYGVDISFNAVHFCQCTIPGSKFVQSELPRLPFKNENFDGIVTMEVLYYLSKEDRIAAITELARILKPGGWCCLSGALDGGNKYFSEAMVKELLKDEFYICEIDYHRAFLYGFIERPMIKSLYLERYCEDILNEQAIPFRISSGKIRILLNWPWFCRFIRYPVRIASLVAIWILKLQWPVRLSYWLGKVLIPEKSKTGIIVLCRKGS